MGYPSDDVAGPYRSAFSCQPHRFEAFGKEYEKLSGKRNEFGPTYDMNNVYVMLLCPACGETRETVVKNRTPLSGRLE